MRKRILKTLLLTTTLMGLFTIGANAEWRQFEEGKWNYYDSNNILVRDSFVDNGQYYVDSNGLWLSDETRHKEGYTTIGYVKETGEVGIICSNREPLSHLDLQTGVRTLYDILFVKESDLGKDVSIRDYKVVNDNGIWKVTINK